MKKEKLAVVIAALTALATAVSGQTSNCHTQKYCDYRGCHDIVVCSPNPMPQCHTEKYCDYRGCHDIVLCK